MAGLRRSEVSVRLGPHRRRVGQLLSPPRGSTPPDQRKQTGWLRRPDEISALVCPLECREGRRKLCLRPDQVAIRRSEFRRWMVDLAFQRLDPRRRRLPVVIAFRRGHLGSQSADLGLGPRECGTRRFPVHGGTSLGDEAEHVAGRRLPLARPLGLTAVEDGGEASAVALFAQSRRDQSPCTCLRFRASGLVLGRVIVCCQLLLHLVLIGRADQQRLGNRGQKAEAVQVTKVDLLGSRQFLGNVLHSRVVAAGDHDQVVTQARVQGMDAPGVTAPRLTLERVSRVTKGTERFGAPQRHSRDQVHEQGRLAGPRRPVDGEQASLGEGARREVDRNLLHQRHIVLSRPAGSRVGRGGADPGDEGPL